jgi:hypothetical protein
MESDGKAGNPPHMLALYPLTVDGKKINNGSHGI